VTSGATNGQAADSLRPALLLIALVLLARIVYLIWLCPYDLVEDEAHYWLWSRHLDWSYYSKGPGIAWVIWASTRLFGNAEWAVRLPTAIAGAIGAIACAGLARDIARRAFVGDGSVASPARAAVFAAAAYMLAPAYQLTGVLVTIDGCYLACWALACWAAWRALAEGSRWAWVGLGAALGAGFIFKYTILLLIPGIVAFALISRRARPGERLNVAARWRPWLIAGMAVFVLGLAPVLIWNAREGWPTVKHLLGHLGIRGGDMPVAASPSDGWRFRLMPVLVYLASPLGMFGPLLIIALLAMRRILGRGGAEGVDAGAARRMGVRFLTWAFMPIFLFYFVVSFIAEPEQNWAIAGFVSLMVLAGWFAADELSRRRAGATKPELTDGTRPRTRPIKVLWRIGLIYGFCAAVALHGAPIIAAGVNAIARTGPVTRAITSMRGRPPGPIVLGRAMGSSRMAGHVQRVVEELRAKVPGSRPFVMCEHYGRASQMAYYMGRDGGAGAEIAVLSPQSVMGGRRSQFDFWEDTALNRPDLIGQPALLMSNDKPITLERWRGMFERVEPLNTPDQKLEGEHKKDRVGWLGFGYRGVGGAPRPGAGGRGSEAQQSNP
jgi:4-amino-4-deoxy-L-arabinose transferase-like glycosyltransferase